MSAITMVELINQIAARMGMSREEAWKLLLDSSGIELFPNGDVQRNEHLSDVIGHPPVPGVQQ